MIEIFKPRSKLGKWMDARGMKQDWLMKTAGINKNTASSLCNDSNYNPTLQTIQKTIKALQEVDSSVRASQFWDL